MKKVIGVWSAVVDVSLFPAKPGNPADLIIQFNSVATVLQDSKLRSTCSMPSGKSKYERKSDPSRQTGWENLKTDINYNGIFPNTFDASKYKSKRFKSQSGDLIDEAALNSRSVIHELGHWMGLRHEYCGLCGYWMHSSFGKSDDKKFNQNKANKYWATRYDAGSIMDSIGLRLQNAALEILKVKGLQPASVSALQDKTVQGVINRINISLGLSPYDQANIALLYPGSNLVNAGAVGTFVLKPSKDTSSQSLVESYLKCMQLYSAAYLETITTPLKARKWQTARKAYLDFVAKTQKDEAASLLEYQTFIANKLVVTGTDIKGVFDVTLNSDASLKRKYHMVLKTRPRHDLARLFPAVMAHSFLSSTRSWALCIVSVAEYAFSLRELADKSLQTLVGDNTWHCSFQPASSVSKHTLTTLMDTSRFSTSLSWSMRPSLRSLTRFIRWYLLLVVQMGRHSLRTTAGP